MHPESLNSKRKRRYRLAVACIAVIVFVVAAGAALATVPAVRDHLCYEHRMNMFCSIAQIGETDLRVFAWHPDGRSFDLSKSPPDEQRSYGSSFPSGTQQRLYWEARLKSRVPPDRSIKFVVHWTTNETGGKTVATGVVEATWSADDSTAVIVGPIDTVAVRTANQLPPGHYDIVLKVYGNQLAESEVRGGFDIN